MDEPVTVEHPALLIRISQLYREHMSPLELYEVTRGVWKLGPRREQAQYALAVYKSVSHYFRMGAQKPTIYVNC